LRKLDGIRVVVTRAAHQAEELARPLRELGAEPVLLPVIAIAPPADSAPLRAAAADAAAYNWIVFTSANAVRAFADQVDKPASVAARIAVIGVATQRVAERHGFRVSLIPGQHLAESLVSAFDDVDLQGQRILIPSAAETRDVLREGLRERGARVDVVEAYRNVLPEAARICAPSIFREPFPDWVSFASSSAVNNLARIVDADSLKRVKIASIGPITSETIRQQGLSVAAEGREHSVQGLIEALYTAVGVPHWYS
jgi:uroporphyrinogen III methyltransferase/synthase